MKTQDYDTNDIDVGIGSGSSEEIAKGSFFAVDRRCWTKACGVGIGMNAPLAYLFLARGTGREMRKTDWSAKSIENRTAIPWRLCKQAIEQLVEAGLVRRDRGGQHPKYFIRPADEVPGCEGYPPSALDPARAKLHARMLEKPDGRLRIAQTKRDWALALDLVEGGHARRLDAEDEFQAIVHDPVAAAKPDWIWLPNALLDLNEDGVAPIELVRQSANPAALHLLVVLYGAHVLPECGGIHWQDLHASYERTKIGEYDSHVIWGFPRPPGDLVVSPKAAFLRADPAQRSRGISNPVSPSHETSGACTSFLEAFRILRDIDLVEMVDHVVDAPTEEGVMQHPCPGQGGEAWERAIALAANEASWAMLDDGARREARLRQVRLIPAPRYRTRVQIVGLARLRWRPNTKNTAAWYSSNQADAWLERYRALQSAAENSREGRRVGRSA